MGTHSVSTWELQTTTPMMKTIPVLLATCATILGAPAPQDFPGSSEVELVPVVQNEPVDYDGEEPVVIVVRPSSFDIPGGFGGFGGFPGFGNLPRLPASFGDFGDVAEVPTISLSDIFGPANEQPLLPADNGCGLICKVFKTLEGQLGVLQGEIDGIKTEIHEKKEGEEKYDNHTVTYDEKVLPDGSILRVNKTTIHDTDENGNGFIFHSAVHHVFQENDGEDKGAEDKLEVATDNEENIDTEGAVVGEGDVSDIEIPDPSENEIDQKFPTLDVTDIDDGLL